MEKQNKKSLASLFAFREPKKYNNFMLKKPSESPSDVPEEKTKISKSLSKNLEYMKGIYSSDLNGDVIIKEFQITLKNVSSDAFIIFYDGMVDRKTVNDSILQPLMILSTFEAQTVVGDAIEQVLKRLLPHNQISESQDYRKVIEQINSGDLALFIDKVDTAVIADVKGWEHRMVGRPNTELVIRGPQEGFNEVLRVNTALVRTIMRDESFIVENLKIGDRGKTNCAVMYVKDVANGVLVEEVKRRIQDIKVDYIIGSGELEQFIEDNSYALAPQVIATERPDRVAELLADGKVAVMMQGSPFALVVPATIFDMIHSAEDSFTRFPFTNLARAVRILGGFFALLLPGLYIAITNFHQEMLPTDLLLAIDVARQNVPFPTFIEVLILEVSFEMIREAGIRIPGPIGPTLGIIGALILGQAAVAANIVSPILIIIVAITGIGSFTIPNYSFALALRLNRFIYIFLGATMGLLGITAGIYVHGLFLCNTKSFGVPIFSPFAPQTEGGPTNELYMPPRWKQEERPSYLNTKSNKKQPKVARKWTQKNGEGGVSGGEQG